MSSTARFRAFDTICSATQDRQDAIIALLATQTLDLMIVLGGYNSSNTCNLARICADRLPTYHIADPEGLVSASRDPPQAGGRQARDDRPRLAAGRSAGHRPDLGRLDPGQPGRTRHPPPRYAGQR